jgi:amino acid permease
VVPIESTYFDMIGFSFFMFEGIGCVMPVMNACTPEVHKKFPTILAAALATLCTTYILFSELCYYTFGRDLNESIVMGEMPASNPIIKLVKVLFCINIMFSYPLSIFPTN